MMPQEYNGRAIDVAELLRGLSPADLENVVHTTVCERAEVRDALLARWKVDHHGGDGPVAFPIRIPRWSAIALLSIFNMVMLGTLIMAYWIAVHSKHGTREDFFISSSIDTGWGHRVGAIGITFAVIALIFVSVIRYAAVRSLTDTLPHTSAPRVRFCAKVALAATWVAVFGAVSVAAVNFGFNLFWHLVFALVTFAGGVASALLNSCVDALLISQTTDGYAAPGRCVHYLRLGLCTVSLVGLVGMCAYGLEENMTHSAAFELVCAISVFSYYA